MFEGLTGDAGNKSKAAEPLKHTLKQGTQKYHRSSFTSQNLPTPAKSGPLSLGFEGSAHKQLLQSTV